MRTFVFSILLITLARILGAAPLSVTPLGNPTAPVKGTFYRSLNEEPETFSPLTSIDFSAHLVIDYVSQGLLWLNPDTLQLEPALAESYDVSKDHLTYTFHLNPKAHWSDGKPVTAEDVQFSIEAVKDPKYKAVARQSFYENLDKIEVLNPTTVQMKMKKLYFQNLEVLSMVGFTPIVPKHLYSDPNSKWKSAPLVGSGPYKVESHSPGKNIILVRDPNWWGSEIPGQKSFGKYEHVHFRVIKDESLRFEMLKKGELDLFWPVTAETFEQKAVGAPFGTEIKKVQIENKIPKRWSFIAWNFKNPLFKDRNVRLALSHLLNRKLMLEKYSFGHAVEAIGPLNYNSDFNPPGLKPIEYNPKKALKLLTNAGWSDPGKTGVLQKKITGETLKFHFTLLMSNRDQEKYFTMYQEDLKKAGIEMEIKIVEWNAFSKIIDEQKFDALTMFWNPGMIEDDLKPMWHSESAIPGGSNFISYTNKKVDHNIDLAREEMDKGKRKKLWQSAIQQIVADVPFTFMFNSKHDLMLVNKRIGYDKATYTYDYNFAYWF